MKVLSPLNADHQLVFIPRYYDIQGEVVLELYNEEAKQTTSHNSLVNIINGFMYIDFEQEFINNSNFKILIKEEEKVVYRGKLFITDQINELQEYKITKDIFTI